MTLGVLEPWSTAIALGLCAALCAHVATLSGHLADIMRLYCLVRPDSALAGRHALWRGQRRLWWTLATLCAASAVAWMGIGVGVL